MRKPRLSTGRLPFQLGIGGAAAALASGALASVEQADTIIALGTLAIVGTLAATERADTLSSRQSIVPTHPIALTGPARTRTLSHQARPNALSAARARQLTTRRFS